MKLVGCLVVSVVALAPGPAEAQWAATPTNPVARYGGCMTASAQGRLHVLGGADAFGLTLTPLRIFDPASGVWSTGATQLLVNGFSVCALGPSNRIFVAGTPNGRTLQIYDATANTWSAGTDLPTTTYLSAGDFGTDGKLYMFGGQVGSSATELTRIYDVTTATWTTGAPLPEPRVGATAKRGSDGRIYVFGGRRGPAATATVTAQVDIYDPATDSWSAGAPLPAARTHLASAATDNRRTLIVLGGSTATSGVNTGPYYSDVYAYSVAANRWVTLPALPSVRTLPAAAITGGRLVVTGGWNGALVPDGTVSLDLDADLDGLVNQLDNCVLVDNPNQADVDGDGLGDACDPVDDLDLDGDGVANLEDNCPFDANTAQFDFDADGLGDACDQANGFDVDGDGVANAQDNCPFRHNPGQEDADADGLGDGCDTTDGLDVDGDGVVNATDNCPFLANEGQGDADADGLGDACDPADGRDIDGDGVANTEDNCPFAANSSQADADADGLGDACDERTGDGQDLDGDGVANAEDNCPFVSNAPQADADDDGIGDACDASDGNDLDGDAVPNTADNCALVANATQDDADADGLGDACDPTLDAADDDGGCATGRGGTIGSVILSLGVLAVIGRRRRKR
jgi:hypothetical protein